MREKTLRQYIREHYDGGFWEKITAVYNRDDEAFELMKFEETVDFEGKRYDVVIIDKWNLDPEDLEVVEDAEEVFFKAIEL